MARVTMATLAFGGTTLDLLGTDYNLESWIIPACPLSADYERHLAQGGSPFDWDGERLGDAPLQLGLKVMNSGTLAGLNAVWQQDAILTWAEDDEDPLWTYVRAPQPGKMQQQGNVAFVRLDALHNACFDGGVVYAAQTGPCCGTFDFPGVGEDAVPGDPGLPALTTVRQTFVQAITGAALGLKIDPATGFDPIDDYNDQGDANALGDGESNALTMTSSYQSITAPSVDTAANAGPNAVFARVETDAVDHATVKYRWAGQVTGADIARTTIVYGNPVGATLDNGQGFEVVFLGELDVPVGAVPNVATGSGWSDISSQVEQTTDAGTLTLASGPDGLNNCFVSMRRTVPFVGIATGFSFPVDAVTYGAGTGPGGSRLSTVLEYGGTGLVTQHIAIPALSAQTYAYTLPVPLAVPVDFFFGFRETWEGSGDFSVGVAHNTSAPATGTLYRNDTVQIEDKDIVFSLLGRTSRAFNTDVALQALSTESSKHAQVDFVERIPTQPGALLWIPAAATNAGEGWMIDNSSPDPDRNNMYWADADGTGPSIKGQCRPWGHLMCWPGAVNRFVSLGHTPANAKPGNCTIQVSCVGQHARLGSERLK